MPESVYYTNSQFEVLREWIAGKYSSVVVLVDTNTKQHCYPLLQPHLPAHQVISILPGEEHKALKACIYIWYELTRLNADRKTLLINLGGGVICDMGGFAAACYKRGIDFINLPTTLLAMVDASVGGKTGIDFEGFKNQIGLFAEPKAVFIYTGFLKTLPPSELQSGFAEVIKHYLIADKNASTVLAQTKPQLMAEGWDEIVRKNIAIKQNFVAQDPNEKNVRKALNFGHTVGHAVESYFLQTPQKLLHGEAIAVGMIAESFISTKLGKLSADDLESIAKLLLSYFKLPAISDEAVIEILKLMKQDKKNEAGHYQFTLLEGIGNFSINNTVQDGLIMDAFKYYNPQVE
jgi:3-dehydroquinate synthase